MPAYQSGWCIRCQRNRKDPDGEAGLCRSCTDDDVVTEGVDVSSGSTEPNGDDRPRLTVNVEPSLRREIGGGGV